MMRKVWWALVWLGLAAPCAAAPLEAYGRLPAIEAIDISPDGKMLASIVTTGEQRMVTVTRLADDKIVSGARAGSLKVRSVRWAGANHVLIAFTSTSTIPELLGGRREYQLVQALDVRTGKLSPLLNDVDDALNVARDIDVRVVDGHPIVLLTGVYFASSHGRAAIYRIDLDRSTTSHRLKGEFEDTIDWAIDSQGEPVAQEGYDSSSGRWTLRIRQPDKSWKVSRTLVAKLDRPNLVGLGRDPQTVLVASEVGGKQVLQEVSIQDGSWGPELPVSSADSLLRDPEKNTLAGYFVLEQDDARYTFFDPADERTWRAILKAYPGQRVRPVASSADRRRIVVDVDSPTEGPAYALVDLDAKSAKWISAEYPELAPADIAEVRAVRFKAQDGLPLTGYLTLPRGREARNLPLVVLAHGGPAARDEPGFDWWSQGLASRGYAVLRVNFRGSDGFSQAFLAAGFGQWGRKMQTDLSDGVRYLASEGIVDPKRVCIVGGSYGGYAALAGATLDRGVYRCAASVAGPADLRDLVEFSRDNSGMPALRYWLRFMGVEKLSDPALKEISPAALADRVEIPILLVHGKDDTVVPLSQSQGMANALKRAGKPVEMVVMPGEDHWLSRGETRQQMLKAVVDFLERNNPPA